MPVHVDSEVGQLSQVILHRPGLELTRLSPQNVDDLLFDDVMWAQRAREEHDAFAEKLRQKGLIYAATPASDFICGTLQMAAGMNVHIFTTGRGTPYGLAAVPVIKVATRTELANRWHDLMDLNAGRIASGEATIEDVGWELFRLILDVASGRKTWAEHWKLHNALALFNPAPVT